MAKNFDVKYGGKTVYQIFIRRDYTDLIDAFATIQDAEGRRALIITDEIVAPLYLEQIKQKTEGFFSFVDVLILHSGEEHKNLNTILEIYRRLIALGFDRKDFLLALGGGVIGDMTGFVAATYLRGIRFIQIPTTLLAQVDSSIGGKTGVDFEEYKNMVGAFHMPSLVYSSVSALKSLDERQYASGMGEVIKHGLIKDQAYVQYLYDHAEALLNRDLETLEETVYRSNVIKRDVVEQDPKEQGERALLNFGHTLGHAIEKCSGFALTHGQCVALGCLAAMHMSEKISEQEIGKAEVFMKTVGLNLRFAGINPEDILKATAKDKKMDQGRIRFIKLKEIGHAEIDLTVTKEQMREALTAIMEDI